MLKYRKKGLCKALSMLLAVAMLLTVPIGNRQAYALEGEQPTVTDNQGELPPGASEGTEPNGVLDSGMPPEVSDSPTDASSFGFSPFGEDITPPAFVVGYPKAGSMQSAGSRQIRITIHAQESAYHYCVVLPDGAPAPSKEQVAVGKAADGNPALKTITSSTKHASIDAGTLVPLHNTAYEVYVVLKDDAGNLSEPVKVDVTSPAAAALLDPTYPAEGTTPPDGSKQVEVKVKLQNTENNKNGRVYWVLLNDGSDEPNIEQVAAGKNSDSNPAISSGSPEFSPGSEEGFLVTGAAGDTEYDLYMVVGDTVNANPLDRCTNVVKLDVTTPADISEEKICEVGGAQYATLNEALAAVKPGETKTITLLKTITHTDPVVIDGKAVTFNLNVFSLTIDTSATNGSTALLVQDGGTVSYTGAGKFSAIGNSTAAKADGAGSQLTVSYAETTRGSAYTVQATAGGSATVNGNVLAKGAGTRALDAITGGKIIVQGNVTCESENSTGALATSTGSTIHVTGDITAIASGMGSTGINIKGDGAATIIGNIAASEQGITTSGLGDAGTVTVTGNVSTTGTATGSADREGIGAGGGGIVTVNGNVSAVGENCTGVYANGSTVTVTGNVTSANTGAVATGNESLRGMVIIDGVLMAGTPYIRVMSTSKTASDHAPTSNKPGYLQYTDGTHSVFVKDPSGVITVANATQLKDALGKVVTGGTIRLTADIDYTEKIVVDKTSFTLDVGNYILNVKVNTPGSAVNGLEVKNHGDIFLVGTGQFNINVIGANTSKGVYSDNGSSATVTNVKVIVTASGSSAFGVYTNGAGSSITALGNVEVTGTTGGCGAKTWSSGEIRIDGTMTAPIYINLNSVYKAKDSGEVDGVYLKYSAVANGPGIVRVKIASAVCEITGSAQYDNLPEAIATATSGQTVKLLNDIVYEKSVNVDGAIQISGKALVLDLNGHNLTIRNPEGAGLQLKSSANVMVTGTGNLNIVSQFAALHLDVASFQSDKNINAILESSINTGIHASYQSTVNIQKGSITGISAGIYTLGNNNSVTFGGPVTVNGKPDWNAHGVNLSGNYTGNTVHVSGKINVASGLGAGIHVENGGTVTVGSSETSASVTSTGGTGIWTRQGSTTSHITVYGNVTGKERAIHATGDADIKVFGDVKSTSALASIYAMEGLANSMDTISIAITGNVEGPNGVKYHGNNGAISVTGNVTATCSASDTVGVYASYGSVAVAGNVSAPFSLGAEVGTNGQITIHGVLSGKSYVKVNNVPKTADDKDATTTKEGYHTYSDQSANATVWVKDTPPPATYTLIVQSDGNGTASANVNSAVQGTEITLTATPNRNHRFKEWQVVSGGVSIVNNKFTMPAGNVVIRAIFEAIPVTNHTVTFNLNSGTRTGGGALTQTVPNGGSAIAPTVTRNGYTFTGWDKVFTNVTQSLTVTATWSYNSGGSGNGGGGNNDHTPIDKDRDKKDKDKKPVEIINGIIILDIDKDNFDENTLVPYFTKNKNEVIVKFSAIFDGKMHLIGNSTTDYLLKDNRKHFTDISNYWAKDDINFVTAREFFDGTGNDKFSPDSLMTRAMAVTALGKLWNADISGFRTSRFIDVESGRNYAPYIEWAAENEIVKGIGNNSFAPDRAITREELAVIIDKFVDFTDLTLTEVDKNALAFKDYLLISQWAIDSIENIRKTEIILGKPGNLFVPKGISTRGEFSAVLKRLIKNIVK